MPVVRIHLSVITLTEKANVKCIRPPWFRPRLPSCGPRIESQAHHLRFFQILLNWEWKKDKNKRKKAGIGPYLKNLLVTNAKNLIWRSWEDRLMLFREEIALNFGFVACVSGDVNVSRSSSSSSSKAFSTDHQYVHCTGNMFLLIPTQVQQQGGKQVNHG